MADNLPLGSIVETSNVEMVIQTVELSIPHGPERNQNYETLANGQVVDRYETEQQAREGHSGYVGKAELGMFKRVPVAHTIEFQDE